MSGRSSVNGLRGQGADRRPVLVRFTYPNDIAGTGFLVWERPGGDDDRFLYLPALGRVRRITGAERQESFVGSDFTYEDIGGRALEDYRIRPRRRRNGSWADAAGTRHPGVAPRVEGQGRRRHSTRSVSRRSARTTSWSSPPRSTTGAASGRRPTA